MTWREILPVAALVGVAGAQLFLVRTTSLSPWKGGGFGMFSTTDDTSNRYVRVFVSAPNRLEEIAISPSLEDAADRTAVLPAEPQFTRLARRVVERERRHQRAVESVRIETWRIEYAAATLAATARLIRTFDYRVETPGAARPPR